MNQEPPQGSQEQHQMGVVGKIETQEQMDQILKQGDPRFTNTRKKKDWKPDNDVPSSKVRWEKPQARKFQGPEIPGA